MKHFFLYALLLLLPFVCQAQKPFYVMTYNIRYNNPQDGVNAWPNRRDGVAAMVRFHGPQILCTQEALHDQVQDLLQRLPGWKFSGVGRDNGKEAGEYSAIFYDSSRFSVVTEGHFWLSQTPDSPALGWDAACIRICCWARFKDRLAHKDFFLFNTHFDHVGKVARIQSALLISQKIKDITKGKSLPVILTGDFNSNPQDEGIVTIKKFLRDARDITLLAPYGPEGTFNGFNFNSPLQERIDYVFVNDKIRVLKYGALTDSKDQRYYSDHLPVLTELAF